MAARTTHFADDTATLLFRGVCAIFQEDPQMVAEGVKFRTWDGTQNDGVEPGTRDVPIDPAFSEVDAQREADLEHDHLRHGRDHRVLRGRDQRR